jgi:hypothetical protein
MSPKYKKPKVRRLPSTQAVIVRRKDGSISVKVPGRNPFLITPGQVDNMPATVDAMRYEFVAKGWTVKEHDTRD